LPQDERAQVPISTALRGRPLNFWERWQASPHAGSAQMAASLTGSAAVISLHFARQGISAPFANFAALAGSVATAGTSYKVFHWLQASPALRTLHEADESLPLRCLGGLLQEWAGRKGTAPAPGTPSLQSLLERQALELLPIFQRAVDGDEGKAWEAVVTLAERQDLSGALRHAGVLSAQDGRDVHYKEWLMSVGHNLGNASSLLDAVSDTLPRAQRERLVLLCYLFCLSHGRQQHGQRGRFRARSAPMRIRKLVMEDGTWRCARRTSPRSVMRG